ncbi:MAG: OmpA family protein, partial [Treponema sp.]|nr:OmpA family protein [Treponema sp.]
MKKFIFLVAASLSSILFAQQTKTGSEAIHSKSSIDWTTNIFKSEISLETEDAGIKMPVGKTSAINLIETELPLLIKEPLLQTYVNSYQQLRDIVLNDSITLKQLSDIIDSGRKTPGVFYNGTSTFRTIHSLNTLSISELMIHHKVPYKNPRPIEQIPSRVYTGIIIDARGTLNVQGEFVKDKAYPCFFPKIWNEEMDLIYERGMGNPEVEKTAGMVHYHWSNDENLYKDRIGNDPLRIKARKVFGEYRTDPVITREDALKILTIPQNMELLREGRIVILLDKENLVYDIDVTQTDELYYAELRDLREYFFENLQDAEIEAGKTGVSINYDLKFVADSAQLLESELPKIRDLAQSIKRLNSDNSYTILVEGHTADVNKPEGQQRLSIQRTQTIINELCKNGLDKSIFSFKGYGGTQPVATNETAEGRAQNRRVIITARPKATYIQRK